MLNVPGAQLFVTELGDGPDLVLMLHGGPAAGHDYLRPGFDALAEPGVRRLFYYDQRGCGRSTLDAGVPLPGWQTHVADIEAIREQLGLPKLTILGYSWGALLALLYATQHRDRVAKLALVSPAPAAARERAESAARLKAASARPAVAALRATLDTTDRRNRFALAVAGYFAKPSLAVGLTPFVVKQAAEAAVWTSLGDYDLRPPLRGLGVPALVVHGAEDPIPLATAQATANALDAQFLAIEDCGHVPYVEAPDVLMPALRTFLL
ncbi:MAG TPA: alpha/beta hydrolase [Polyangia bacterium]|nr:alpha/beta hydrolase [Polyangia bacterium]